MVFRQVKQLAEVSWPSAVDLNTHKLPSANVLALLSDLTPETLELPHVWYLVFDETLFISKIRVPNFLALGSALAWL